MNITEKKINDVVILNLDGNLMGGPEAVSLNETINRFLDEGVYKLVINLEKVNRINSSGLGILIKVFTTFKNNGGELKLTNVNEKILNLFKMTRLDTILNVYESVDSALNSF